MLAKFLNSYPITAAELKLNNNNETKEAKTQQIWYSEYQLLNHCPKIQSLVVSASLPLLVSLSIVLTYLHETRFFVSFSTEIYINFPSYEHETEMYLSNLCKHLLKMNQRLDNYCNNSSLDFSTWMLSITLPEKHCRQWTWWRERCMGPQICWC